MCLRFKSFLLKAYMVALALFSLYRNFTDTAYFKFLYTLDDCFFVKWRTISKTNYSFYFFSIDLDRFLGGLAVSDGGFEENIRKSEKRKLEGIETWQGKKHLNRSMQSAGSPAPFSPHGGSQSGSGAPARPPYGAGSGGAGSGGASGGGSGNTTQTTTTSATTTVTTTTTAQATPVAPGGPQMTQGRMTPQRPGL